MWSRPYSSDNGDLVNVVVPFMGESITDGTLAKFLKKLGDHVNIDEPIAHVEINKVTIDVVSPEAGIIQKFLAKEGYTVEPRTKVAVISKSVEGVTHVAPSEKTPSKAAFELAPSEKEVDKQIPKAETLLNEILKEKPKVPMTRLRKHVATCLKDSQNTFEMLTTFNEVNMTNFMKLRSDYTDAFIEKHGMTLGLMSGFVKATVSGLQNQPIINAVIDRDDIIYRDYIDISIAVGTPKNEPIVMFVI
ncbi:hypothetical protein F0562_006050 [Nyssa sinensis]|uniref:Dihydrolipoamide acetyltransferase component of pyruvate dehydrogenase complex n=1 Tax=Nyssa sinensis TaxID=561372 RepID=A0A5J5AQJ4_9ASTE|nr:hypothetical protein F0562_006050 [Nyssa sinensis]